MTKIDLYTLALEYLRIPLENALRPEGMLADDLPIIGDGADWADTTRALREGLEKSAAVLQQLETGLDDSALPKKISA